MGRRFTFVLCKVKNIYSRHFCSCIFPLSCLLHHSLYLSSMYFICSLSTICTLSSLLPTSQIHPFRTIIPIFCPLLHGHLPYSLPLLSCRTMNRFPSGLTYSAKHCAAPKKSPPNFEYAKKLKQQIQFKDRYFVSFHSFSEFSSLKKN